MTMDTAAFIGVPAASSARVLLLDVACVMHGLPRDEESALGILADLCAALTSAGARVAVTSQLSTRSEIFRSERVRASLEETLEAFRWSSSSGFSASSDRAQAASLVTEVEGARKLGSRQVGGVLRRWLISNDQIFSLAIVDRSADLGTMSPHSIWIGGSAGMGQREVRRVSDLLSLSIEGVRTLDERVLGQIEEEVAEFFSFESTPYVVSDGMLHSRDQSCQAERCLRWVSLMVNSIRNERMESRLQRDRIAALEVERIQMRRDLDSTTFTLMSVPRLVREIRSMRAQHEAQRARLLELEGSQRAHRSARSSQSQAVVGARRGRSS